MPDLFEAYVTNLGKYNEGELVGEYLKFPTTPEEVQALLKRIGIDGVRYEEIFITDFDGDVLGLYDHLGEYENIDELNHLACVISELDQGDLEKFEAVIDSGEYTGSVKELINLAQNLDCFELYPGISNEEELGRMYIEDFEALQIPEHPPDRPPAPEPAGVPGYPGWEPGQNPQAALPGLLRLDWPNLNGKEHSHVLRTTCPQDPGGAGEFGPDLLQPAGGAPGTAAEPSGQGSGGRQRGGVPAEPGRDAGGAAVRTIDSYQLTIDNCSLSIAKKGRRPGCNPGRRQGKKPCFDCTTRRR